MYGSKTPVISRTPKTPKIKEEQVTSSQSETPVSALVDTPSQLGEHGKDLFTEKNFQIKDESDGGKHGEVIFCDTPENGTKYAVKRQVIFLFVISPNGQRKYCHHEIYKTRLTENFVFLRSLTRLVVPILYQ
jgi:hypothetical protein